jgi:hypothetical protein
MTSDLAGFRIILSLFHASAIPALIAVTRADSSAFFWPCQDVQNNPKRTKGSAEKESAKENHSVSIMCAITRRVVKRSRHTVSNAMVAASWSSGSV